MYFSKEYKENIESISVTYVESCLGMTGATVVKVTFKQWWKLSRKWKFPWAITDVKGTIFYSKQPTADVNALLNSLQD